MSQRPCFALVGQLPHSGLILRKCLSLPSWMLWMTETVYIFKKWKKIKNVDLICILLPHLLLCSLIPVEWEQQIILDAGTQEDCTDNLLISEVKRYMNNLVFQFCLLRVCGFCWLPGNFCSWWCLWLHPKYYQISFFLLRKREHDFLFRGHYFHITACYLITSVKAH